MSAHTPGPWKVIGKGTECRIEAKRNGPTHMVICERVNGYRFGVDFSDYSQLEANARLIAQAPRMLDLLKEARRTLEMWKDVAPAVSLCADIDKVLNDAGA